MKFALAVGALFGAMLFFAAYDMGRPSKAAAPGQCKAPADEGDITMITIDVRAGQLFIDCQYGTARRPKPKTKGG